mmetsp:Transcript_58704/g.156940  ORF Transcript_58704/g.156940 Transcript_58704/m.156940 type:complete len:223 (+) Transcript_58704:321-989(+)
MRHVVTQRPGHSQSWVHLAFGENTVRNVAGKLSHFSSRLLNPLFLHLKLRLVIRCQILGNPLVALLVRHHSPRIPSMSCPDTVLPMQHHRASRPRQARVKRALVTLHEVVRGLKSVHKSLVGLGSEGPITHNLPRQILVHKQGHVMPAGTMAVKDAVHSPFVDLQDEEVILIGTLWFEPLLTSEPDVLGCQKVLVPHELHLLIFETLLWPSCLRSTNTHLAP